MNTVGYLLLLIAGLIINAVARGRVMHLPSDLGEAFTAAITGDYAELKTVLTASGDDLKADGVVVEASTSTTGGGGSNAGVTVLAEMKRLGAIAGNKYVLGTTGPRSYDCSGLVWRACKNTGNYNGARFTTRTFPLAARSFCEPVSNPTVGDIALWTGKHMGVVSGPGRFYSALNHSKGIVDIAIFGNPRYFRIAK